MAGLGWAVKLSKPHPVPRPRRRWRRSAARPLPRLLAGFTVADPEVVLLGRETIYRDGKRVGWLSSGGWGYTVGTRHRLRLRARPGERRRPRDRALRPLRAGGRDRARPRRKSSSGRSYDPAKARIKA